MKKKKFGKPTDPDKRRQRNHHKDGTLRSDEERAEFQSRRTESGMKKKAEQDKKSFGEKGTKKPFKDKKERSESEHKKESRVYLK